MKVEVNLGYLDHAFSHLICTVDGLGGDVYSRVVDGGNGEPTIVYQASSITQWIPSARIR